MMLEWFDETIYIYAQLLERRYSSEIMNIRWVQDVNKIMIENLELLSARLFELIAKNSNKS